MNQQQIAQQNQEQIKQILNSNRTTFVGVLEDNLLFLIRNKLRVISHIAGITPIKDNFDEILIDLLQFAINTKQIRQTTTLIPTDNKLIAIKESLKVISRILGINIISDEFATLLNNIKNATITLTNINKPSTQQLPLARLTPKLPTIDDKFEKFISNHK
ncbi:hypothetical protein C2G38_2229173 [Gigaspora rosea]|uniref:Uncharacterized protein n=1 Tax=Gigaspora rosea TaxID=44941 RepID=A0A397U3H1_9GLOM|nr:hypothetical protein C2G38_2229173 [Gigaspora rosea]